MTREEQVQKIKKFVDDPDFYILEDLLKSYFEPMVTVESINTTLSNDEIATEVRGRQMSIKGLQSFLTDVLKFRGKPIINNITTFK